MSNVNPKISDPVAACIDFDLLRDSCVKLGLADSTTMPDHLLHLYRSTPALWIVAPNGRFDEAWYRSTNSDVSEAIEKQVFISGFVHYVLHGILERRWPNPVLASAACAPHEAPPPIKMFNAEVYLSLNKGAQEFLDSFPIIDAVYHYNHFGRFLGMFPPLSPLSQGDPISPYFEIMAEQFDPLFYVETYLHGANKTRFDHDPFTHYLIYGIPNGASPSAAFDEGWYRAFYPEISMAIDSGKIPCGFYHYVVAGRVEGRLPRYERKDALEARMPGVTRPILLERISDIRTRMKSRKITVSRTASPRIWVFLPTMNPDITFGGYRSVFELIHKLHQSGRSVTIVCTEDGQANKAYFLWREASIVFRKLVAELEVIGHLEGQTLEVGLADVILVYSLWDLYVANDIRKVAPDTYVVLLAQEYEPIFYDNCTARALAEEAYRIPHYPLINSNFLRRFFEMHKIGVFSGSRMPQEGRDFTVFEHRINQLVVQTADEMRSRRERVLVAYARPEGHAARNMFELLVLALQQVCDEGLFGPEWRFVGLGALTEIEEVSLGGNHVLVMHPKMTEEQYTSYIRSMDIGISLMFAPHPSVMPFEFATTGALVVTNSYENRSEAELAAISGNIVAGRPSIQGIVGALRQAVARVPDVEQRVKNAYKPGISSWDNIFNDALLQEVFGPPQNLPYKPEAVSVVAELNQDN